MLKLGQCLRNCQGHQAGIIAERIAAQPQNAQRNLKFGLICNLGQCKAGDHRMRMHLLQAFIEIRAFTAYSLCKQPLLRCRRKRGCHHRHQRCGRCFLISGAAILTLHHIDLDRPVKNCEKLCSKTCRNCQICQGCTAGKRHIADLFNRIRNTERYQRIAVREQIFGNLPQHSRQADLLILAGCGKCIRADVTDRIRKHQTVRSQTAAECIHINDLKTLRQNDMHQCFQPRKCLCSDPAQAGRQINRAQGMLRLIHADIKILRKVRRKNRVSLRNFKHMIPDGQLFRFGRSQNILALLHQLCNGRHARSRKQALFRPVQLDLRTEQEIFHSLSVREALAEISVCQTGAAGECVRLDLLKRFRQLQSQQTRAVPESLCLNAADSLRNLKPFAALRDKERPGCDHSILLQRGTALDRAGKPLGYLMRIDLFIRAVLALMNRNKCKRLIELAVILRYLICQSGLGICLLHRIQRLLRCIGRGRFAGCRCGLMLSHCGNRLLNLRDYADLFLQIGNGLDLFLHI